MTCWRCGRVIARSNGREITWRGPHADWCSDGTPNDCSHCGGNPCRWWCIESHRYAWTPNQMGRAIITGRGAA